MPDLSATLFGEKKDSPAGTVLNKSDTRDAKFPVRKTGEVKSLLIQPVSGKRAESGRSKAVRSCGDSAF